MIAVSDLGELQERRLQFAERLPLLRHGFLVPREPPLDDEPDGTGDRSSHEADDERDNRNPLIAHSVLPSTQDRPKSRRAKPGTRDHRCKVSGVIATPSIAPGASGEASRGLVRGSASCSR